MSSLALPAPLSIFKWKISRDEPPWGTCLRRHDWEIYRTEENKNTGTWQNANPGPLDHKAYALPLCRNNCTSWSQLYLFQEIANLPKLKLPHSLFCIWVLIRERVIGICFLNILPDTGIDFGDASVVVFVFVVAFAQAGRFLFLIGRNVETNRMIGLKNINFCKLFSI